MNKKWNPILLGALGVTVALSVTACASDDDQLDDAPVGIIDDSPAFVMTNPDLFPNISVKCYEGNALYTTTRDYNSLTIIQDDPACADGNPVPTGAKGTPSKATTDTTEDQ